MSEKVNKQLSISSCLKLFTEQMERGDKIFSQELIFRTDDPSSQHNGQPEYLWNRWPDVFGIRVRVMLVCA